MRRERHVFRAKATIRWAVLGALVLWLGLGAFLAMSASLPMTALLPIGFFVIFFTGFVAYYWSMAYVVDEYGVTYRGATEFVHIPWEDIDEVQNSELPLGGAWVSTERGGLMLNHFVRGHEKLVELVVARAGLFPT